MANPTPKASPTPTPSPNPQKSSGTAGPSQEAQNAAANVPQGAGGATGEIGLTGVPIGTEIKIGSQKKYQGSTLVETPIFAKTQYKRGSGAIYFSTKTNQERIDLLAKLAQIPGLYDKKDVPTLEYLKSLAGLGVVPYRKEDIEALERVMYYADSLGEDVDLSINKLYNNPKIAQDYFNIAAGAPKKISITPDAALTIELDTALQDYLDMRADKKLTDKYIQEIQGLEKKRGGSLTSLERDNILLNFVQAKAAEQYQKGAAEDSSLLEVGALGRAYKAIKNTYNSNLVPVDDKKVYQQAIESIRSKAAMENILNKISLQAKAIHPSMAAVIDAGGTVSEALAPYKSVKSKIFGISTNDIKNEDLYPIMNGKDLMSIGDWTKYLYSLPEYKKTQDYQNKSFNDAQVLLANFLR